MMSATPMNSRVVRQTASDVRAGATALVVLRFTLLGVAVALLGTIGNVVLKLTQG
jgi:hypothetical protein